MFDLTNEIYQDKNKAREHLEAIHWPDGPVCPHCGNLLFNITRRKRLRSAISWPSK